MCDFSEKLIARMDGELAEGESAELERHLSVCNECRNWFAAYARASRAFDAYCDATFAAETRYKPSRWLPAAVAVGAVAAAIAALLILPHQHDAHLPPRMSPPAEAARATAEPAEPTVTAASRADASHLIASEINRSSRQYAAVPRAPKVLHGTVLDVPVQASQERDLPPFAPEPHIEIAIPAEDVFPPGAVPPGMSFSADLTISPDGSPERLGLRPRLAGFERRTNLP